MYVVVPLYASFVPRKIFVVMPFLREARHSPKLFMISPPLPFMPSAPIFPPPFPFSIHFRPTRHSFYCRWVLHCVCCVSWLIVGVATPTVMILIVFCLMQRSAYSSVHIVRTTPLYWRSVFFHHYRCVSVVSRLCHSYVIHVILLPYRYDFLPVLFCSIAVLQSSTILLSRFPCAAQYCAVLLLLQQPYRGVPCFSAVVSLC